jgi:hypothetical protein
MPTEKQNDSYQKHKWVKCNTYSSEGGWHCTWKCLHCGCKATDDYAEKIGLDKLDIVDPCKMQVRKGNGE